MVDESVRDVNDGLAILFVLNFLYYRLAALELVADGLLLGGRLEFEIEEWFALSGGGENAQNVDAEAILSERSIRVGLVFVRCLMILRQAFQDRTWFVQPATAVKGREVLRGRHSFRYTCIGATGGVVRWRIVTRWLG